MAIFSETNKYPSRNYDDQRYNTFFSAPTLVTGGTFTQHNTTITNQNATISAKGTLIVYRDDPT